MARAMVTIAGLLALGLTAAPPSARVELPQL